MRLNTATMTAISDDLLWQQSRDGDREAFGRIVERYQSLICSLAYSACGNLSRSEDLAQETFVTAWLKLGELREPSKLRAWLCGIVRNLSANSMRRERRRGGPAESLDAVAEHPSEDADPAARAVTQEDADLLWRSLAGMPETYREPMVLFYRQGQSITEVARSLELSGDAVKQRLSRGRALLREEMTALVESTLTRTKPGIAFRTAVLVALPMASASTASAAIAAGTVAGSGAGSMAGKGLLAKIGLGVLIGPLIGLVFAWLGKRAAASTARSGRERACILRHSKWIIAFCFAMSIGLAAVLSQAGKLYTPGAAAIVIGITAWTAILVGVIIGISKRLEREVRRIRAETATSDEAFPTGTMTDGKPVRRQKYFESRTRLLGLPLFAMTWGGYNSDSPRRNIVHGWIAIGDMAVSPFLAFGGVAIAPIAMGAITIGVLSLSVYWGVAIGVLSLGSLAFGWWAVGCAAAGIKCAVGFAAVARDYALGIAVSAREAGTEVAKEWFKSEWLAEIAALLVNRFHWWLFAMVLLAIAIRGWRDRQARSSIQKA
jgi:RNA polymerase sigma factor (sigma-70 family)